MHAPSQSAVCPLCRSRCNGLFHNDDHRDYLKCAVCQLVFVPPFSYLSPDEERAQYDLHENDPADERYRAFLSQLFNPVIEQLPPNCHGLDFGCGPGPTLSVMFEEAGHRMSLFDPFYANNPAVFEQQYDFITSSEVFEHLHHPAHELDRLFGSLKPGGVLGVMTQLVRDQPSFANWHYIQDPTHVCFYSDATLLWVATRWKVELTQVGKSVALFRQHAP